MNQKIVKLTGIFSLVFASHVYALDDYTFSLGVGGGRPYGSHDGAGVKLDYHLTEQIYASIGTDGKGIPTIGVSVYGRSADKMWRPRVGLYYGVVDDLDVDLNFNYRTKTPYDVNAGFKYKTYYFNDLSFEVGQTFNFGKERHHAIEFGLSFRIGDGGKADKRNDLGMEEGWFDGVSNAVNSVYLGYKYNF